MKKHHFTLIELLVVIAVIAILCSMLMPAMGRVRENAKSSTCTNNLRQYAMLFTTYHGDYDRLPPHGANVSEVSDSKYENLFTERFVELEYLPKNQTKTKSIRYCPSSSHQAESGLGDDYNVNRGLFLMANSKNIDRYGTTVFIGDGHGNYALGNNWKTVRWRHGSARSKWVELKTYQPGEVRGFDCEGEANFVMLDGSVRTCFYYNSASIYTAIQRVRDNSPGGWTDTWTGSFESY